MEYVLAAYVILSAATTVLIFRLDYFEKNQAILQTVIAWLFPFLGAVLILVFLSVVHRNMTTRMKPDRPNLNNEDVSGTTLLKD